MCYFDVALPDEESALLSVMNAETPINRVGFFGPQHECVYCLTKNETLSLFHADKAIAMAQFPTIRDTLRTAGAYSDYLVDCHYMEGSGGAGKTQKLILMSGDHAGNLSLSDVTLAGATKLCSVNDAFGHSTDVRAAVFYERKGSGALPDRLFTGGDDGKLCDWSKNSDATSDGPMSLEEARISAAPKATGPSRRRGLGSQRRQR